MNGPQLFSVGSVGRWVCRGRVVMKELITCVLTNRQACRAEVCAPAIRLMRPFYSPRTRSNQTSRVMTSLPSLTNHKSRSDVIWWVTILYNGVILRKTTSSFTRQSSKSNFSIYIQFIYSENSVSDHLSSAGNSQIRPVLYSPNWFSHWLPCTSSLS